VRVFRSSLLFDDKENNEYIGKIIMHLELRVDIVLDLFYSKIMNYELHHHHHYHFTEWVG